MSYFSDLNLRLRADGIYPERVRAPQCGDCHQETAIIGYEQKRLVFSCRSARCVSRSLPVSAGGERPEVTATMTLRITCVGCSDATDHELVTLADGSTLFICSECEQTSLLPAELSA